MKRSPRSSKGRWIPNFEGGLLSFALEALLVLVLALLAIAVAAVALLIF